VLCLHPFVCILAQELAFNLEHMTWSLSEINYAVLLLYKSCATFL
jgi:hypothetical protein